MLEVEENNIWKFPKPVKCVTDEAGMNTTNLAGFDSSRTQIQRVNNAIVTMDVRRKFESQACYNSVASLSMPKNFTWRTFGGDQVERGGMRDQKTCGGCWAFSVASVLGDRIALANQLVAPYPSSAWLISQGPNIMTGIAGCEGNNVYNAAHWIGENSVGLKLEKCWPFDVISESQNFGGPSPTQKQMFAPEPLANPDLTTCCSTCCDAKILDLAETLLFCEKPNALNNPDLSYTKYIGVDQLPVASRQEVTQQSDVDRIILDIQMNLLSDGPVTTSCMIYDDFIDFWRNKAPLGEIYERNSDDNNKSDGGHAMVIVGWGYDEDRKKSFWEVRNSWGRSGWNEGYIKVAFSTIANKPSWIGLDIPFYDPIDDIYKCGVVTLLPAPVPNLDVLLAKGILKRSNNGNLLNKSRALIGGFDKVKTECINYKDLRYTGVATPNFYEPDGELNEPEQIKQQEEHTQRIIDNTSVIFSPLVIILIIIVLIMLIILIVL